MQKLLYINRTAGLIPSQCKTRQRKKYKRDFSRESCGFDVIEILLMACVARNR